MFRAILSTVLIAIVAWPHALCFCHALHATSHNSMENGNRSTVAQGGHSHDDDDEDDDDGECTCCKLRQVLVDPAVPMLHETDHDFLALLPFDTFISAGPLLNNLDCRTNLESSFDARSALKFCALRI